MNTFPAHTSLNTLAIARENYARLLAAFEELKAQLAQQQTDQKSGAAERQQCQRDLEAAGLKIRTLEARASRLQSEIDKTKAVAAANKLPDAPALHPLIAQLRAISDPAKQMAFFRKHRQELILLNGGGNRYM